jgi:hypothetical protein
MNQTYRCTNCQGTFPVEEMSPDPLTCNVCAHLEPLLQGEDLRHCADCGEEYDALTFPHGHLCDDTATWAQAQTGQGTIRNTLTAANGTILAQADHPDTVDGWAQAHTWADQATQAAQEAGYRVTFVYD